MGTIQRKDGRIERGGERALVKEGSSRIDNNGVVINKKSTSSVGNISQIVGHPMMENLVGRYSYMSPGSIPELLDPGFPHFSDLLVGVITINGVTPTMIGEGRSGDDEGNMNSNGAP